MGRASCRERVGKVASPLTTTLPAGVPGRAQVGLFGPQHVKLIVPVAFGQLEPASSACAWLEPPRVACGVALVITGADALLTTLVSFGALHAVVKPLLLTSPE